MNLLALFISLFLCLIITEIIISNILPQSLVKYNLDSDVVHRPMPNAVVHVVEPEFEVTHKINSKGLLDYEYDYPFEGYTIVMLGDSFTEGIQVNISDKFSKILEKKLKSIREDIRVVNCGIGNTGTDQQYQYLKKECIKYNPDLVILNFYIGNDFENNYASLIFDYENGKLIDKRPVVFSRFQKSIHWLNTHFHTTKAIERTLLTSNITRKILFRIGVYKTREKFGYNLSLTKSFFLRKDLPITETGFNKTSLIFKELANYTNSKNIGLIVTILPKKEEVDSRKYLEYFGNNSEIDISKPNSVLKKILRENYIESISLLPEFKRKNINNTFYYEVDSHFNKDGNKLAAEIIYRYLVNKEDIKKYLFENKN